MLNNIPKSNIHTHTTLSDGKASLEEVVESAISKGFSSLGISDHSFTYFDECCIHMSEESYAALVRRAAEKYKDIIDIFCGLELDSHSRCKRELYDYIIGSVHFLRVDGVFYAVDMGREAQRELINNCFGGSETAFAKMYYTKLAEHIERCRPDVVGHFDLITKYDSLNEDNHEYRDIVQSTLRRVISVCDMFEVNTGAMARANKKCPYPADFILEEILKLGGRVTLTSDCHNPEFLDHAFDDTLDRLHRIGFDCTYIFSNGGFVPYRL